MTKPAKTPQPLPPLARLFPDLPPEAAEAPAFDFEGLAKTLAELAVNPDNRTPFTVVVKGGWGRGKTTLLRRAKWLLEHPGEVVAAPGLRRVETLWFNAWKYPDEDTVLAGLLGALLDRFQKGKLLEQLKLLVDSYKGSIVGKVLLLAAPAPLKSLLGGDRPRSRFSPVEEKRAFHDTFRDLFNQVSRLLFDPTAAIRDTGGLAEAALWTPERQRKETLAIFLDDLDRCRQERVAEVLEAINLFLDLPGVCFYLGLDWRRLVAALPEPVRAQGDQYLEKIVQITLDLPTVSAASAAGYIASLVRGTHLAAVLGVEAGESGEGKEVAVVAEALGSLHPRHIKRFLNDLSMTLAVLRNAERLGPGEEQIPEAAVLGWHLLSEVLPAEKWREVRALPSNAKVFLQSAAVEAKGEKEGELPEEWRRIRESGLGEGHLASLAGLNERQLHVLVYLASPPVAEVRGRAVSARADLLDLESAAWVPLEGGTFEMGSASGGPDERPVHRVTLSPFRISLYPVTNADYALYVQEAGKAPPGHWAEGKMPEGKENHPVVNVSWSDAEAFCTWQTRRLNGAGAKGAAQLPTEAQWEFAARGVAGREYPWGEEPPDEQRANFGGQVGDTTPVGSYPLGATPEGIQDLAGNVWEWCRDWKGSYPGDEQRDPTGPEWGRSRVLRGGAFGFVPGPLRGASRRGAHPGARDDDVGFRVVWLSAAGLG
jgi:formylglycine-generating enzyme required for sulfatase activity